MKNVKKKDPVEMESNSKPNWVASMLLRCFFMLASMVEGTDL